MRLHPGLGESQQPGMTRIGLAESINLILHQTQRPAGILEQCRSPADATGGNGEDDLVGIQF
jgi:hypothetical protein